ncbi:TrmH family RNA methyltransferase, partial [Leifsonia sp. SIMBA_070]
TISPQGIVAVCRITDYDLDDVLASGAQLIAVLCEVRDPGNAGTILRAADSAGADAVILTAASVDIHNPKAVRSTAGSLFHL